MKPTLAELDAVKANLVAAWNALLPMEGRVEATGPCEYMKHAKEKLVTVIANVEVLRRREGAPTNAFEPGDSVLIVASIEQGITGVINRRAGSDCWRIDYFAGRLWCELCWWQIVNLSR